MVAKGHNRPCVCARRRGRLPAMFIPRSNNKNGGQDFPLEGTAHAMLDDVSSISFHRVLTIGRRVVD